MIVHESKMKLYKYISNSNKTIYSQTVNLKGVRKASGVPNAHCSCGVPKPRLFDSFLCVHVSPTIMGCVCLFCLFVLFVPLENNLAAMEAARTLVAAIWQGRTGRENIPMAILRSRGPEAHLVRAQRRGKKKKNIYIYKICIYIYIYIYINNMYIYIYILRRNS